MKLLLDESIPQQLERDFPEAVEVTTVQKMSWAGTKNGALLALAAANGFDVFITADKGIEFQHSPESFLLPVVVLSGYRTRRQDLQPLMPNLRRLLGQSLELRVYHIGQ
jgi:hypothetical protein